MNNKRLAMVVAVVMFLSYVLWWLFLELFFSHEDDVRNSYSLTYGILAGYGGILGIIIAKKWGGFKSYVGKSLIFFAFGLLCQFLGQNAYSLQYLIDHIENAYPSYGEIFFFASVPSYILGVYYIGKAAGSVKSLKLLKYKILSIVIPSIMVFISYYMFIRGVPMDGQSMIAIFLNFFYPIGQGIFLAMAIMAYLLSGKVLGGVMKRRVIFILFSLAFQYVADSVFLYKTIQGTFYHADFCEFLFAISYSIMTFAFLDFATVFGQLKDAR